jgi:hypothetical protein
MVLALGNKLLEMEGCAVENFKTAAENIYSKTSYAFT